jgi:formylglycine-generating enzyme required for sulfatase activity
MNKTGMKRLAIATLTFACAFMASAMPTKEDLVQAQALVADLTADDVRAMKSGAKKPGEVAAAQVALAGEAETEAGKYLLLQGAFRLYARSADYDAAADVLARMRREIADLPPEVVVELVDGEMRRVAAEKAEKVLAIYREARRMIKCRKALAAAEKAVKAKPNDMDAQRRVAECHAVLGDWTKALEAFAKLGEDAAKFELDPASVKDYDVMKAANFWWEYPTKENEPYKVHAVALYQKGLADGSISGLRKTLAEKRIKQIETLPPVADDAAASVRGSGTSAALDIKKEEQKTAETTIPAVSTSNGKEISVKLATGVMLEFVPCPAGTFEMGHENFDQSPEFKHKVTITRPFWIGKYQVTRGVWAQYSKDIRTSSQKEMLGGNKAAMVDISFQEVLRFCDWLNHRRKTYLPKGYVFRLPTEAEWEYALNANGGKPNNPYIKWRDGDKSVESQIMVTVEDYKRIADKHKMTINLKEFYFLPPMTVGTKDPNDWGIYDMLGNGREFVFDTLDDSGWPGKGTSDELVGKGILLYKESETDPLRFVADRKKWHPLIRGTDVTKGAWYAKCRGAPYPRFGMKTTFRLVIGPDLLKERGIKMPDIGK